MSREPPGRPTWVFPARAVSSWAVLDPAAAWPSRVLRLRGDLAELLVHGPEQEDQRHGHDRDHQEPEHPRGDVIAGRGGRGDGRQHAERQRHTLSRTPANRSSSGNSLSTTDLAR